MQQIKSALQYYRGTQAGTRSLESMQHRFRWFERHHFKLILRFEEERTVKRAAYKTIEENVFERFKNMSAMQLSIRDMDIRYIE